MYSYVYTLSFSSQLPSFPSRFVPFFLSIYVFSCLALILLVGSPMHLTAAQTIEFPIYCTALHMLNAIEIKMG